MINKRRKKFAAISLTVVLLVTGCLSVIAEGEKTVLETTNAGVSTSFEQNYYIDQMEMFKYLNNSEAMTKAKSASEEAIDALIASYSNLAFAQVDGNLNIRKEPSITGEIVGKIPNNAACDIIESAGEWVKIESGKVTGYVKSEYLIMGDAAKAYAPSVAQTMATVTSDALRLREEPNTECKVIMNIMNGEELEVIEVKDGWIKVEVNNDIGYLASEFAEVAPQFKKAVTIAELKYGSGVSDIRVALVTEALKYVGNPYVWGGVSLTRGADCSGYVLTLYKKMCGISLPHSSRAQAGYGRGIKSNEAKPGDLFFYGNGSYINHVAMYIGGGQCVHAFSESQGIKITSAYYRDPVAIRSLLD